jgi:hypothetical protein
MLDYENKQDLTFIYKYKLVLSQPKFKRMKKLSRDDSYHVVLSSVMLCWAVLFIKS